jgi:hypothetical protein
MSQKELPRTSRRNSIREAGGSIIITLEPDAVEDLQLEPGDTPCWIWDEAEQTITLDFS